MLEQCFCPSFIRALPLNKIAAGYKRLIIVQLSGGNDGLNTIIPIGQDPYFKLRPQLALQKAELTSITSELSINAALNPLASLFDKNQWAIISDVGYPNPNRSHFRSMDIWQSASKENEYLNTGWIGRYFDQHNESKSKVLEIDAKLSLANTGAKQKAISFTNPNTLHKAVHMGWVEESAKNSSKILTEDNLGYLYQTLGNLYETSDYLKSLHSLNSLGLDFGKSPLGHNLKVIAELMSAGADTKVFYTSMGGFDTHVNQKTGHAKLLNEYATSMSAFINALKKENLFNDTLIMTFSEFGRRVKQNASKGTDHGTANSVFIMSGKLKKSGLINGPSNLLKLDNNDLIYRVDFRNIYAEIIEKWLEVSSDEIISNISSERVGFI